jgi:sulfatase modifying factor 1
MGMDKDEAEARAELSNEEHRKAGWLSHAPRHNVRLTQAYYLGTHEVKQEQFEKVLGSNP